MAGRSTNPILLVAFLICTSVSFTASFQISPGAPSKTACVGSSKLFAARSPHAEENDNRVMRHRSPVESFLLQASVIAAVATVTMTGVAPAALADEYGVSIEAPTLYTGETKEICIKRGPLGACTKTAMRTEANDNDKAANYFKSVTKQVEEKGIQMRKTDDVDTEEGGLVERLKKQTEDNRERNEKAVKIRTFENDLSASSGPFSRQVVIMNTDGETFSLLEAPQAMRLKKAGYIKGRKYVKMPTTEVLEQALESPDYAESLKGILGIGGGDAVE